MPLAPSARVVIIAALALAFPLAGRTAPPEEVYPVRLGTSEHSLSLNGSWRFKYRPGSALGDDRDFSSPGFGDAAWATIAVPGHWELQGFAEPKYAKVDDGTGLYRRTFQVPANWTGERIFLRFEGVLYGFDAWINGTKVGTWASAYNPVSFDITDALKPGADNLLAIKVSTHSHGWEFDTNDCWALSGIYRDVTLFAVPKNHLIGFSTETKLQPDGSALLTVTATRSGPGQVRGRLIGPDGMLVNEFDLPEKSGVVLAIARPQLWTAESPALYRVELALDSGQKVSERIGLREVAVRNGVLQLNGRSIKLRGADHHDLWPINGRVATEELMRRDLELMRAANINFIRTSHYPPHPRFLELCDELGFYVMDEVPFGFGENHLNDPDYQETLLTRAGATIQRDRNHASVVIWSVGNENPNTPLTLATGQRVKQLDPSRPICFPQIGTYFPTSYHELPDWVDLYAPHYPNLATVRDYATRLERPVIFTEYAHALGLAADQLQDEWAVMQASPRLAGGAVWMFQDQGILRSANSTQSPDSSHNLGLAVWPDSSHYYDTAGNLGMDGLVYSDRTPQPDYWEVRKVYSPVQIPEATLPLRPGANRFPLHVENRFDFRSLAGFTLEWALVANGQRLSAGAQPLQAAAHATETITIETNLPVDRAGPFTWLELRCLNEQGTSLYERHVRLSADSAIKPSAALLRERVEGSLSLDEAEDAIRITHPTFSLTVDRRTGEISFRDPAGQILAAGPYPHIGRRWTEGELVRSPKELTWTGAFLRNATELHTTVARQADGIVVKVSGSYARPDAPEQLLVGETVLLVKANGGVEVSYDFRPINGQGLLLEAGVSFVVPPTKEEFRWVGAGPYAGFPGKDALNEFGRYHLSRADLYFEGNRRAVEVAVLSDARGSGLSLLGDAMDVAVERVSAGTIFSHNALISGRGTKFARPDAFVEAKATPTISGHFMLVPLNGVWPATFTNWFGPGSETATPFHPYFHSYDQ